MSRYNNLPFPRGSTYWGGDASLISASQMAYLEGKTYLQEDANGSGAYVRLRVLRNSSGGRLKGGRGVQFGATADWLGRKVRGYTTGTVKIGMGVDDAYSVTSVANGDLFYAVQEGPFKGAVATLTTGSTALLVGDTVAWGASGLLTKIANATAVAHPYGEMREAVTHLVTGGRAAMVFVGGLFSDKV